MKVLGYKIFECVEHGGTVDIGKLFKTAEQAYAYLEANGSYFTSYKIVGWYGNYRLELIEEDIKIKKAHFYERD